MNKSGASFDALVEQLRNAPMEWIDEQLRQQDIDAQPLIASIYEMAGEAEARRRKRVVRTAGVVVATLLMVAAAVFFNRKAEQPALQVPAATATPPAPVPPRNVRFNGVFESHRGSHYTFIQTRQRIDVYLLHQRVGTAYADGDVLRFERFYSSVHQQWGTLPPMHWNGDRLVAIDENGTEQVFFTRVE